MLFSFNKSVNKWQQAIDTVSVIQNLPPWQVEQALICCVSFRQVEGSAS